MAALDKKFIPKTLREQMPADSGGINARQGFSYQDHVAAKFSLEMLCDEMLSEVWCETYDDIVLVWHDSDGTELVEFVQVKHEELQQLYTPAIILQQKDSREGTSLFERSLGRDRCTESVRFRIVSSGPIAKALEPLTFSRDDNSRNTQQTAFETLKNEICAKPAGTFKSLNGHDVAFWLEKTMWEVHTWEAIEAQNKLCLARFLETQSIDIDSEARDDLYEKFLSKVKKAAEASFLKNRTEKILPRNIVDSYLKKEAAPQFAGGNESKLRAKLAEINLPEESIDTIIEIRRNFKRHCLEPGYLPLEDRDFIIGNVRGILHELTIKLYSGEIAGDGLSFLKTCIDKLNLTKEEYSGCCKLPDREFLLGIMYDITSRCRHRFKRPII